jgi:hypothetical protein
MCTDVIVGAMDAPIRLNKDSSTNFVSTGDTWQMGATLRVKFLSGTALQKEKVVRYAKEWSKYCSIKFNFVETGPADIRVNFRQDKTSWSLIGTASLYWSIDPGTNLAYASGDGPSMNFGWFTEGTEELEYSSVIIHEFGHALSLIHEHQSPAAGIPWDSVKVYAHYKNIGWSDTEVNANVFEKYKGEITQMSQYDKHSIMHYPIADTLLKNPAYAVGWNRELSSVDKAYIRKLYP